MPRATSTASLPRAEVRDLVTQRLSDLVSAIEAHPQFRQAQPHKSLYYIWDFVQRTRYAMTELDNIAAGRPPQHPEQLKGILKPGDSGPAAAAGCFNDVCTRSWTIDMLISRPTSMVMMGLEPIDCGEDVKAKSKAVSEAFSDKI